MVVGWGWGNLQESFVRQALAIQPASTDVPSLDLDALAAVAESLSFCGRIWAQASRIPFCLY